MRTTLPCSALRLREWRAMPVNVAEDVGHACERVQSKALITPES